MMLLYCWLYLVVAPLENNNTTDNNMIHFENYSLKFKQQMPKEDIEEIKSSAESVGFNFSKVPNNSDSNMFNIHKHDVPFILLFVSLSAFFWHICQNLFVSQK